MSKPRSEVIWQGAMLTALLIIAVTVFTAQPEPVDSGTFVASRLRCPVCQSESVLDSPSETARQMRDIIDEQLANGKTTEQVFAYFVEKYGEWILLDPDPVGRDLLLWLVPIASLGVGILLIQNLRRRRATGPASTSHNPRSP